jgi:mRNA interferase RelE/StbE
MYRLEFTAEARRQIHALPSQKIREQIEAAVLRLAGHPDLGKRLQGELHEFWSYRSGNYRIIYQIFRSELRILIIALGARRDIYKKI